jgi:hypothetical protein
MTKRERRRLLARIRANCCEFHGLTPRQRQDHIEGIARIVEQAENSRQTRRK